MVRLFGTSYGKVLVVVTSVAAVALVASAAWAVIPDASGTIHACVNRDGELRVIDTDLGQTCRSREKPLSWSAGAPPLPDAFVAIRHTTGGVPPTGTPTEVVSLAVPAGKYAVTAKAEAASRGTALDPPVRVFCTLGPGSPADDFAALHLAPVGDPGEKGTMALLVSRELSAPGSVSLSCFAEGNEAGASLSNVVLRAVEVGSITTDPGPGPLP